jgi:hypothetical protein
VTGDLEVRAELQRLGRLMHVSPDQLGYLSELPPSELRALRMQVADVLFAPTPMLERIAASSKLLPNSLGATIGEKVFGPVIVARLTPLIDVDRAIDMSERLPVKFLADVGAVIDPRRVEDVLAKIPPAKVAEVTAELLARKEYVALGSYVASLPDESLRAALAITSPEDLLLQALVLEHKDRLSHLYTLAPAGRYEAMYALAPELGYGEEARELLQYFSDAQRSALEAALTAATA